MPHYRTLFIIFCRTYKELHKNQSHYFDSNVTGKGQTGDGGRNAAMGMRMGVNLGSAAMRSNLFIWGRQATPNLVAFGASGVCCTPLVNYFILLYNSN